MTNGLEHLHPYEKKPPAIFPTNGRRRVYIASSWKQASAVNTLAIFLEGNGMEVFAFTEGDKRPDGLDAFTFGPDTWEGPLPLKQTDWINFMDNAKTERAFRADKAGLDWADTVVLLLPCGRSAHLEAGYAVGQGKELYVWGDLPPGEYETMYGFADGLYRFEQLDELIAKLKETREDSLI